MKKFILMFAVTMIASYTFAQDAATPVKQKDVPVVIIDSFYELYPNVDVNVIKWTQRHKEYIAAFTQNGMEHVVYFDAKGNKNRTRIEIKEDVLPANAQAYATKNFPKEEFKKVEQITDRNGRIVYMVRTKDKDYYFDANGNYMEDAFKSKDREVMKKDGSMKNRETEKEKIKKDGKVIEKEKRSQKN